MTARFTELVWPLGKPPRPTDADKAEATAFVDAWFSDETLCPVWKERNREDLIRSEADCVMRARVRAMPLRGRSATPSGLSRFASQAKLAPAIARKGRG